MIKIYADLTKLGIVIFVLLCGLAGYAASFRIEDPFLPAHLFHFVVGLYFLSSGSLALNQVQEYKLDRKMARTAKRPIAAGVIQPAAGWILSVSFIAIGLHQLYLSSPLSAGLGALTVFLYNLVYTYWWKKRWVFGAVPGAIPGALPVTIGYAANSAEIFNSESVYLFLIMFLWQMPHFWALALRFRDDYEKGGVPTLPVSLGIEKTLYHMGLYTLLYVGVAYAAPLFILSSWTFILLVIPLGVKVLLEFWRLYRSKGTERWLAFFLWTNLSVIVFLFVPVIDKWNFLFVGSN